MHTNCSKAVTIYSTCDLNISVIWAIPCNKEGWECSYAVHYSHYTCRLDLGGILTLLIPNLSLLVSAWQYALLIVFSCSKHVNLSHAFLHHSSFSFPAKIPMTFIVINKKASYWVCISLHDALHLCGKLLVPGILWEREAADLKWLC